MFYCEKWLSKSKSKSGDGKIKRSLYAKGYDGEMMSERGKSTVGSGSIFSSRTGHSTRVSSAKRSTVLGGRQVNGPKTEYTVRITTGQKQAKTVKLPIFLRLDGVKTKATSAGFRLGKDGENRFTTDRVSLSEKLVKLSPGGLDSFTFEATDVGVLEGIEVGHDEIDGEWNIEKLEVIQVVQGVFFKKNVVFWAKIPVFGSKKGILGHFWGKKGI